VARLPEFQGKIILASVGIAVPRGEVVRTAPDAAEAARRLAAPAVVKGQAWTTARASQGLIRFADSPAEAERAAAEILSTRVGAFPVSEVLVGTHIEIALGRTCVTPFFPARPARCACPGPDPPLAI
jgi:succinyl-CoA synthetase beta subunit